MSEQQDQLNRVRHRIGDLVWSFCAQRMKEGLLDFHMEALQRWVREKAGIAPDSPSRILRELRSRGSIDYVVVNRRNSHYRLTRVAEEAA